MKAGSNRIDRGTWLVIGLLVLVTTAVYSNSLKNGFVWDDMVIVVSEIGTSRLEDIPRLFLEPYFVGDLDTPYYRPLNRSIYVLDSILYGNDPAGYHLENVLVHALAVVALYLLSLRLFERRELALAAACLFAVHPVNTEAVDFISARYYLLTASLVLASFHCYVKGESEEKPPFIHLSAFLFLLALLCMETALMLLAVLALYGAVAFGRSIRVSALATRLWPFAVSLAIYLALRGNALRGTSFMDLEPADLPSRLFLNVAILPKYLALLVFPVDLSISRLAPEGGYPLGLGVAVAWLVIPAIAYALWRTGRPATRLGLLWLAVNYVPISNLVPIPSAPMAERFLYIPAIGFWWVAADQFSRIDERGVGRRVLRAASVAVLIALASLTFQRNFDWRSNVSLFEKEVHTNPSLAENHYNLCMGHSDAGDFARAEAACIVANTIDPGDPGTLTQLGNLQQAQRRYLRARSYYQMAVEADPRHLNARYNLARLTENLGQLEEAFRHYQALTQTLPPDHPLQPDIRNRLQGIARSGRR